MKAKRRWPKAGEKVEIQYGRDISGQWWWISDWSAAGLHGPFLTNAEAERDAEVTILGSQCEVKYGGRWDPAWDKKQ